MSTPLTPNPPVNTGAGADMTRLHATDAPGTRAGGWVKTDADIDGTSAGGWHAIDDVGDDGEPQWRQC